MTSIKEEELKKEIEEKGKNYNEIFNRLWDKSDGFTQLELKDLYNLFADVTGLKKQQGIQEERERIKDKWITFINNLPFNEGSYSPTNSVGFIRDEFLEIIEERKMKGGENENKENN
jgi:hypothetical protein